MKGTRKNKLAFILMMAITMPLITIAVVLPRMSIVTELLGGGALKTGVYDVYFADYSDDPDSDASRFTLNILLDLRNPYSDRKIVIPRVLLNLEYLDKKVGTVWTTEELILEPFTSNQSRSAGLLPLYITLYVGGETSGLAELINGVLLNQLGAIGLDVTVYLGDVPVSLDILLGSVLSLVLGESGELPFELSAILSLLGGDSGGGDSTLISDDYLILYNTTVISEGEVDVRALLHVDNRTIITQSDDRLIFGSAEKFSKIHWENGTTNNNANGDGNYTWQYWNGNTWVDFPSQPTMKFNESTDVSWTIADLTGWAKQEITLFWKRD